MENKNSGYLSRRNFLASTGAAAAFSIIRPELVFGTEANSKINLGLIGCGDRGTWIAGLFNEHGGYNIAAVADYFQDKADACGQQFNVPADRRFTTLSCYQKMLDSKAVDAIAIISPPYFHPIHAQAGVEAGVHVYLAKPIAVDVPGTKSVEAMGQQAAKKNLCFLVDFQTRTNEFYIEAVKRVHAGAIGDFVFGESMFIGDGRAPLAEPGTPEARLRNWTFDKALSGDLTLELAVHVTDVTSWIINAPPLHATGTCASKINKAGDAQDFFTLVYEYADKVGVTLNTSRFPTHGTKPRGISNRMFGTQGVLESEYGGEVMIRGGKDNFYRGGKTSQIYKEGAQANIAAFHKNITEKNFANATVPISVQSNLVSILGREAAYQSRRVTWDEVLGSQQRLDGKLDELKS